MYNKELLDMDNKKLRNLRDAVDDWERQVLEVYMNDLNSDCDKDGNYSGEQGSRKGQLLSCPFCMGLTPEYLKSMGDSTKMKVMVIGQEVRNYGIWKKDRNESNYMAERWQRWAIEYLLVQLYVKTPTEDLDLKSGGIWRVFRDLKKEYNDKICLCWNNIDKVYYVVPKIDDKSKKSYKGTLTYKAEEFLSKRFGSDNKSLLQREIEIAKPDALLFVTGPSYYLSMATAFGIDPKILKGKLNKETKIVDITNALQLDITAYWTYHPCNRLGINCAEMFVKKSTK